MTDRKTLTFNQRLLIVSLAIIFLTAINCAISWSILPAYLMGVVVSVSVLYLATYRFLFQEDPSHDSK